MGFENSRHSCIRGIRVFDVFGVSEDSRFSCLRVFEIFKFSKPWGLRSRREEEDVDQARKRLDQAVVREQVEGVVGRDFCGGSCSAGVVDVFGTLRVTCGCWAGTRQEYVWTKQ